MRSNYAGGLGYGNAMSDGAYLDATARQAVIGREVLKAWRQERKDAIRKYQSNERSLKKLRDGINEFVGDFSRREHSMAELKALMENKTAEFMERAEIANDFQKALAEDYRKAMMKAGLTTSIGYNFYDLRGPAYLIYPVNVPFRNMLPRWGKVNAGYGTAANWKYQGTTGPGTSYAGAAEGERVATATPTEISAFATYKELGIERSVTFTAEFAGEGYTDNVADEHLRGLHELWLQEESLMLFGNAGTGTGNQGFQLGQAHAPICALEAAIKSGNPNDGGTGFANSTPVSVRVVELTVLGNPNNAQYGYTTAPVASVGLTTSYTRTNADGTQNTINGGTGQISAASNVVTATTSDPFVRCIVNPKPGANAWAWFVDTTDSSSPSAANAFLVAITTVPLVYLGGATPSTYAGNSTGLSSDHSNETLDYDGFFAWTVNQGTWINMAYIAGTNPATGAAYTGELTPGLSGSSPNAPAVQEIEYDLLQQWQTYQTVSTSLWCSVDAKLNISGAVFANTSGVPAFRFDYSRDAQGNILGGFVVSGYKNMYSMKVTGSEELPLHVHPQFPPGTIMYDVDQNPYPHSRIPGVRGMFVQREYYSIEWPLVTRTWTFGTYVHEVFAHYIPGLLRVRTGISGVALG